MERPSWDEYGLALALAASTRSDCLRRQVGAVILTADHRLRGSGYNASPAGEPSCLYGGCKRVLSDIPSLTGDYDNCSTIHAEANAIMYTDLHDREGGTIYVSYPPCAGCHKLIRGSGIVRVVTPEGSEQLWTPPSQM